MVCKMPETLPICWLNVRLKLGSQEQSVASVHLEVGGERGMEMIG